MDEGHTWEELELPVLRWVHQETWAHTGELQHLEAGHQSRLIPPFTDAVLDEALRRLDHYGLITGTRDEALVVWWKNIRLTSNGLRVLGEWPPVDAATVNVTLARVLRTLAGDLDEEAATATRRAGSALAKMSGDVVLDVVTDCMKTLGEDVVA